MKLYLHKYKIDFSKIETLEDLKIVLEHLDITLDRNNGNFDAIEKFLKEDTATNTQDWNNYSNTLPN